MITCTKCGIAKEETLFYNRSDTKTKKTEQCKLCMTIQAKQWRRDHPNYQRDYCNKRRNKHKLEILNRFNNKCAHCGLVDNHVVYDLHHLNPTEKEYNLAQILDHSLNKIENELTKCILLCSNCHRKEHEFLRQQTEIGYGNNQKELTEIKESDILIK